MLSPPFSKSAAVPKPAGEPFSGRLASSLAATDFNEERPMRIAC